jgi:hypothetical protein
MRRKKTFGNKKKKMMSIKDATIYEPSNFNGAQHSAINMAA